MNQEKKIEDLKDDIDLALGFYKRANTKLSKSYWLTVADQSAYKLAVLTNWYEL